MVRLGILARIRSVAELCRAAPSGFRKAWWSPPVTREPCSEGSGTPLAATPTQPPTPGPQAAGWDVPGGWEAQGPAHTIPARGLGQAGSPEAPRAPAAGPLDCSSSPSSAAQRLCSWMSWWKEWCTSLSSSGLGSRLLHREWGGVQAWAGPVTPAACPFQRPRFGRPLPGGGSSQPITPQPQSTYPWSSGGSETLRTKAMSAAHTLPVCRPRVAQSPAARSL